MVTAQQQAHQQAAQGVEKKVKVQQRRNARRKLSGSHRWAAWKANKAMKPAWILFQKACEAGSSLELERDESDQESTGKGAVTLVEGRPTKVEDRIQEIRCKLEAAHALRDKQSEVISHEESVDFSEGGEEKKKSRNQRKNAKAQQDDVVTGKLAKSFTSRSCWAAVHELD